MARLRFSVAGMLAAVFLIGLGIAALRESSEPWAAATISVTYLVLGIAIVALCLRQGEKRAFWIGFAVLGWMYFLAAFVSGSLIGCLGTSELFRELNGWVHPPKISYRLVVGRESVIATGARHELETRLAEARAAFKTGYLDPPAPRLESYSDWSHTEELVAAFTLTGHALLSLILGCLGGTIGVLFYRTGDRSAEGAGAGSESGPPSGRLDPTAHYDCT